MSHAGGEPTGCVLLTPAGMGAIAVIRVFGPRAVVVVGELFQPVARRGAPALDPQQPQRLSYGEIVVEGETLDEVILCASVACDGRLQVDISTHGGIRVIERVLMALQARGVSVEADPGQQPPAWPAANEIEAEVIEATARAKTRRAVDFLLHQSTVLPEYLDQLAAQADRDPVSALAGLQTLAQAAEPCLRLVDGATIAIIGPRNAGKSTLANRLFGAPRAVVSPVAGTTRDWVAEGTAIRGIPVTLVDTPGVAATSDPLEALAIRRGMTRWSDADLRLVVLDGSRELPDIFCESLSSALLSPPLLVVANKGDLPRQWSQDSLPPDLGSGLLTVSALRGDGLATLEERILAGLGLADRQDDQPGLFTRRQREAAAAILSEQYQHGWSLAGRIREELIGRR